jgi:predicted GNAT superfamily acetyltransferase
VTHAPSDPLAIRDLTTLEECLRVVELEKDVWGYADGDDVVPAAVLLVSVKRGGILLGAFDRDRLTGFVYSMPAVKDGRPTQWSHMLGVTRDARGTGLGLRLKLAQRERALAMGIDEIEWTFDPLQALNAHLNIARLGAVVDEYEENIYGESTSPLHQGSPTDRFIAVWRLTTPHVERRLSASPGLVARDAGVIAAPVVNPSSESDGGLEPGDPRLTFEDRRILVEIPGNFTELLARDPGRARRWRMATRLTFQTYFARGYRVVDFILASDQRRGQYVLERGAGVGGGV